MVLSGNSAWYCLAIAHGILFGRFKSGFVIRGCLDDGQLHRRTGVRSVYLV
jgi:hypothetical protein